MKRDLGSFNKSFSCDALFCGQQLFCLQPKNCLKSSLLPLALPASSTFLAFRSWVFSYTLTRNY